MATGIAPPATGITQLAIKQLHQEQLHWLQEPLHSATGELHLLLELICLPTGIVDSLTGTAPSVS